MENLQLINDENWEKINKIKWFFITSSNMKNYNEMVSNFLIKNYTINEIQNLFNFVVDKRIFLENQIKSFLKSIRVEERKNFNLNDEELMYFCSHIVGLGDVFYNFVLSDLNIIFHIKNKFKKCFEYGFDIAIYELNK